jgi:cytochrome c1
VSRWIIAATEPDATMNLSRAVVWVRVRRQDHGRRKLSARKVVQFHCICHSLELLAIRTLAEPGGPAFSMAQVEALASEYRSKDLSDTGELTERAGRPADHFPSPFPNELAARSANGRVAPPDMSTLAKARSYSRGFPWFVFDSFTQYQEHGPDYIAALLTGYAEAPKDFNVPPGSHYNTYFPGHVIAMAPPLQAGQVSFDDDAPRTVDQYSKDGAAFLM